MASIRKGNGKGSLVSNLPNPTATTQTPNLPAAPVFTAAPVVSPPSAPIVPPTPGFGGLALPSDWTTPTMQVVVSTGATSPYLKFIHPQMSDYMEVTTKVGVQPEATPVLIFPNGDTFVIPSLKFILLNATQYWALETKNTGEMKNGDWKRHKGEDNGCKWNERILTAILVELDGEWYPATCEFKGPKCVCAERAMQTFHIAKQVDQWKALSPDHAFTAQIGQPQFRYVTNVSMQQKTSRSDDEYIIANGSCVPITAASLQSLMNAFGDGEFNEQLKQVIDSYTERLNEVKGLIGHG